jgi:hypothetical protein
MHMQHQGVNGSWLAVLVSVVALSILGITLLVSMFDARIIPIGGVELWLAYTPLY